MTLFKAVEAAREALTLLITTHFYDRGNCKDIIEGRKALAALPAEPKSEDEIAEIIANTIMLVRAENSRDIAQAIIEQLKAANVLYVSED